MESQGYWILSVYKCSETDRFCVDGVEIGMTDDISISRWPLVKQTLIFKKFKLSLAFSKYFSVKYSEKRVSLKILSRYLSNLIETICTFVFFTDDGKAKNRSSLIYIKIIIKRAIRAIILRTTFSAHILVKGDFLQK